jgi:1,4-dihydroxy-6-naphthoate synthase
MHFSLAFSPCPNDTFIFDALVNKKIDTLGHSFSVHLEDVETLNQWALEKKMDFTKISYGVLHKVQSTYQLLNSGSALGKGVGPLLIAKKNIESFENDMRVAIPGLNTTAHLLFSLAYPQAKNKIFSVFHEIEDAVLSGDVDAGVIIHENRFTYQDKGLKLLNDLGAHWENTQKVPIPLGGIIAKKSIDPILIDQVDQLIKKSIEYAFSNYPTIAPYVKEHSQEMSEDVMRKHIDLYVNNYSLDLGIEGRRAIEVLMKASNK